MFSTNFRPSQSAIALGLVVAVSCVGVVRAERAKPAGSIDKSCSSGTACVEGDSSGSTTWGVYGIGSSYDGVHGVTSTTSGNSAVAGISQGTTGDGNGVYGRSSNGPGVYGTSTSSYGVYGVSSASNDNVSGIYAIMKGNGWGAIASSDDSSGLYGSLYAYAGGANTAIFYGYNDSHNVNCTITSEADLSCSGSITGSAMRPRHRNDAGQKVLAYASESTTATIEDFGTARMYDGIANVQISPDFASVMDHKWYYVFLTPLGDTRGLYVSMKAVSGFQVRETERGRDSLEFDYRVVAHPGDAKYDRLPPAPRVRKPQVPAPIQ